MGQEHWLIVVEGDNDIWVVLRHPEVFHSAEILPAVRTYEDYALGLQISESRHAAPDNLIPDLRVIGHRLIHQLIGDPAIRVLVQLTAQFFPAGVEFLLSFRVREKGSDLAVEVV